MAVGFDAVVLGANGLPGGLVGAVEGPNEKVGLVPLVAGAADGMLVNENLGTDSVDAGVGAVEALKLKAEVAPFAVFCSDVGPRAPFNEDEEGGAPKGFDIVVEVPFTAGVAAAAAGFANPKSNLAVVEPAVPVVEAGNAEVAGTVVVGAAVGLGVTPKLNVVEAGAGAAGFGGSAGFAAGAGATRESNELPEVVGAGAPNIEGAAEGLTSVDAGVDTGPNEKVGLVEGFSSFFAAGGAAGAKEKEGTAAAG